MSKYVGKKVLFRFRYHTDGGIHEAGPFLDDVSLKADGKKVWTDDVENGSGEWTPRGFTLIDGSVTIHSPNYYVAENRAYVDYDETLKTGPYQFGWADTRPKWVERFPYQNGLLIWHVDESYPDNRTGAHPGHGLVLPVDARPKPIVFKDGTLLGNRRQPFDATFGLERTDAVTFHRLGEAVKRAFTARPFPCSTTRTRSGTGRSSTPRARSWWPARGPGSWWSSRIRSDAR